MNDQAADLDQAGEDIFAHTISDEALEAASGTEIAARFTYINFTDNQADCC